MPISLRTTIGTITAMRISSLSLLGFSSVALRRCTLMLLMIVAPLVMADRPPEASMKSGLNGGVNGGIKDPYEAWNRRVFAFNELFDRYLLKPTAQGYRAITLQFVRTGVHNVLRNGGEIYSLGQNLLQGDVKGATVNGLRFFINSTVGIFGLFDLASEVNLKHQSESFNQTLAVWGVPQGPYVVLPFFGPSSVRGSLALGLEYVEVDGYSLKRFSEQTNPLYYWMDEAWYWTALRIIALREDLLKYDNLLNGGLDKYLMMRMFYEQRIESAVHDAQGNPMGRIRQQGSGRPPGSNPDQPEQNNGINEADDDLLDEFL